MMEFTAQDGSRLFVNPDAIWHIRNNGVEMSAIYGVSGAALFVRGSVDDIANQVTDWQRAERARAAASPPSIVKDRRENSE